MSLLLGSAMPANDDETANPFPPDDENDNYDFKYIPANRFKYIVKDVRRQRCREMDESVWTSFVKQQELDGYFPCNENDGQPIQNIKDLLEEGMKDADEQLERLEMDIFSNEMRQERSEVRGHQKKRSNVNKIRDSPKKELVVRNSVTSSTNLLLTIPEEENAHAYERRRELEDLGFYTRKSRSSHVVARKKRAPKKLCAANGFECSSSPENSARHNEVVDSDIICVRPDAFAMQRIMTMRRRVCELLDEIALRLGNIPQPDSIKDLQRRQQCVTEFVVRFSRNYLYDLNRQVADIQRHMCIVSPRAQIKPNRRSLGLHMHAIEQKLLTTHQMLLHALVAYCKHIPSSIHGHPGKLKELLRVVVDLRTVCDRLHQSHLDSGDADMPSLGNDMESKCNAILSKLKSYSDNEHPLESNKMPSMMSVISHSTSNNKKRANRKQLSNRLSMYNTNIKSLKNKRSNAIGVKRISNESIQVDQPYPSPITLTPSKDVSETGIRKHKTYTKEEDIKTMMDALPTESDNGSNVERHDNANLTRRRSREAPKKLSGKQQNLEQSDIIENIVKSTSTNNDNELAKRMTETIMEEHLSDWVPIIAEIISLVSSKNESEAKSGSVASAKTLIDFLQKRSQSPKSSNTKISASTSCVVCHVSTNSSCGCERLKTNRISSGTQQSQENMRLICVSSMENASETSRYCDASCQADYESLTELPDFETIVKMGRRLKDPLGYIELVVTEEIEINFLKYRREYQHSTQSIPMYSSNTQNKPWDIVAWIADKLVEELIVEIGKELQMDEVIQKLFELEFQEF